MEYFFVEQDPEARGYNQFCHEVTFHLRADREMELFEFLEEAIGKRGRVWRLKARHSFNLFSREPSTLRFIKKSDAMRFKLSWEEDSSPESELEKWMRKINLNSLYGGTRRGAVSAVAPTWTHTPISQSTPGIWPTSGKTLSIQTLKSRYQSLTQKSGRYSMNPCDEVVILDYESNPLAWYDQWIKDMEVISWTHYEQVLDMEIRNEERSKQAKVGQEASTLQAGLQLPDQSRATG